LDSYGITEYKPDINYFPATRSEHYLTFDVDLGGLNNIRMAFEYVVVIAAITGRILVLPPAQPWYLINFGPSHQGNEGGVTNYPDIFDIDALLKAIPLITHTEFIRREATRLKLPEQFKQWSDNYSTFNQSSKSQVADWKNWLFENSCVIPWNPYETLVCIPDIQTIQNSHIIHEGLIDGRELTEFTQEMKNAPVIHFPCRKGYRQLGQVAAMITCENPAVTRQTRQLLKNCVRYTPRAFEIATKLINTLPDSFDGLHIRRNDFQFQSSRTNATETLHNISNLLADDQPIYIATDEVDEEFFDVFERDRPVYRWDDFFTSRCGKVLTNVDIPFALIGPVEQLICAHSNRFVGTELSTFSSYITRLRGYLDAPDKNAYFHTQYNDAPLPLDVQPKTYRGKQYLREFPVMWEDC